MRALLMILAVVALAAAGTAAEQKPPVPAVKASAAKATATSPVNLNTATQAQLETLPGIGAKVAERILEHRQKNGSFKKVEETIESSRSGPYLLAILGVWLTWVVSGSRQKSQQISP